MTFVLFGPGATTAVDPQLRLHLHAAALGHDGADDHYQGNGTEDEDDEEKDDHSRIATTKGITAIKNAVAENAKHHKALLLSLTACPSSLPSSPSSGFRPRPARPAHPQRHRDISSASRPAPA